MYEGDYSRMRWFKKSFLPKNSQLDILGMGFLSKNGVNKFNKIFSSSYWNYTSLDIEKGNNIDIVASDIYNIEEIDDNSFDVVVSTKFFEYLRFYWKTFGEIKRILKPGGYAFIVVSSSVSINRSYEVYNKFKKEDLIKLAEYFDFEVVYVLVNNNGKTLGLVIRNNPQDGIFKHKLDDLEEKIGYFKTLSKYL